MDLPDNSLAQGILVADGEALSEGQDDLAGGLLPELGTRSVVGPGVAVDGVLATAGAAGLEGLPTVIGADGAASGGVGLRLSGLGRRRVDRGLGVLLAPSLRWLVDGGAGTTTVLSWTSSSQGRQSSNSEDGLHYDAESCVVGCKE